MLALTISEFDGSVSRPGSASRGWRAQCARSMAVTLASAGAKVCRRPPTTPEFHSQCLAYLPRTKLWYSRPHVSLNRVRLALSSSHLLAFWRQQWCVSSEASTSASAGSAAHGGSASTRTSVRSIAYAHSQRASARRAWLGLG